MGTGNTNAVFHAGKLLALKEDDLPYEIDPDTLETIGKYDYRGAVKSLCMSAHPKVDTVEDKLLTYAYQAKGDATKDIVYYEFNGDGALLRKISGSKSEVRIMPAIFLIGGALVLMGAISLNQAAGAIDKTGEGARDLAIAGAVIVGGYLALRQAKVLK